ncbi:MAG: ABC transporter ATP-binding protein [Actinomycetota bacterium]
MSDLSTDIAIELIDINKNFQNFIAVNNLNLQIRQGEFFSMLGPSGCGKTTTLRMIAGLETPSSGKIMLDGKNVTTVPAYKRNVNTVFQDYAIFPHMTLYDNIYFPLKMKGISRKDANSKILKMLRIVSMEGLEKRFSSQISGGQRQRIALARALVNEPKALLLDEPLGALDFKLRVAMQTVLKEIQSKVGITFVYVTHDQTEAITMSDRIAVMRDGIAHQIGSPDEIYNKPKTAFVASFIGEMNFLEGKIIAVSDKEVKVKLDEYEVYCEKNDYKYSTGDEALVCVRPEKVLTNPVSKQINEVKCKLARVVFRGNDYEITARLNGTELKSSVSAVEWGKTHLPGEDIIMGWDLTNSIIYPIEMKKNIISYGE